MCVVSSVVVVDVMVVRLKRLRKEFAWSELDCDCSSYESEVGV